MDLFLRYRDIHPFLKNPALIPESGTYYQQVITDYFSKIQSKAQKRGVKANAEDDEPFKLQLIVTTGQHTGSTYLHESVRHEFCGPQLGNLYVYDVSTPESVSILITDYPPTKAKKLIPIVDVDGQIDMAHKPLWKSCT